MPGVSVQIGGTEVGGPLQIAALLTLLSLAPAILVTLTGFVRVVIVLSFLRQAVGTQGMPPNQVVVSLAPLEVKYTFWNSATSGKSDANGNGLSTWNEVRVKNSVTGEPFILRLPSQSPVRSTVVPEGAGTP